MVPPLQQHGTATIVARAPAQAVITASAAEAWVPVRLPCHPRRVLDWAPAEGNARLSVRCRDCHQEWVLLLRAA